MTANGNFSDVRVERFYSVSQNKFVWWGRVTLMTLNFMWFTNTFS